MERLFGVLEVVLPVVAMVLTGYAVRRLGIVSERGIGEIKELLVKICLPAVLFGTFYAMEFTWREAALCFTLSGVTLLAFALGFAAKRMLGVRKRIAPWLCTTIEGGSIGYALFILLYGKENLYHLALLDAGNALIQWTLVMSMLALSSGEKKTPAETVRSLISPINCAIAAGLLCSAAGIGKTVSASAPGRVLEAVLDFAGTPVAALILMTVGYGLSVREVEWKETAKMIAARAVIFAAAGFGVYRIAGALFPENPLYRAAALIFFILPPTYAYPVYVKDKEESAFLSGYLAAYTLLTIAAFAVVAAMIR
ncbi:MAG: hypothetical protein IJ573_05725 [Clostridia bacterium]|nr:hypothetical protein [Clostridia bacterium]